MDLVPTVVLKNDIFNFDGYLGTKIHGLTGFQFFNSFAVKVNYENNRLIYMLQNLKHKMKGTKVTLQK